MNPIRRLAAALAGLGGALLAFAAIAPAALAQSFPSPPPGQVAVLGPNRAGYPTTSYVRTVVIGGMPGWQIALIAAAAALFAVTVAVLADRAWAARRKTITATA
jgi:hypothetical protein